MTFIDLALTNTEWTNRAYTLQARNGVLFMDYYILHASDAVANTNYNIGKIPEGYRPRRSYDIRIGAWCANLNGQRYGANVRINNQGTISFVGGGTFREAGFSFAIPI